MVVLDLETTGLSITKDRIVQIACIKGDIEKKLLINPTIPIPKEASDIHGITDETVKDADTFKQISKSLLEFLKGEDLAGYNSNSFDIPVLIEEFHRAGIDFNVDDVNLIDVYRNECEINPRNLEAVYKRMIGKNLADAHDALADARATKAILEKQVEIMGDDAYDSRIDTIDLTGKLILDEDDNICWNFGKHKGKPVSHDMGYISWVLKGDFIKQVKDILRLELSR